MREKAQSGFKLFSVPWQFDVHMTVCFELIGAGALKLYSQKSLKRTLVATLIIFPVNE